MKGAEPSQEVEALLLALYEQGRAAWPAVTLSPGLYCARLAAHAPADATQVEAYLRQVKSPTDLFLAEGCVQGLKAALEGFETQFLARVPAHLSRLRQSPSFVDEIQQMLRERLLVPSDGAPPRLAEFAGRSSLSGWLRTVSVNMALNVMRAEGKAPPDEERVAHAIADAVDPERRYMKDLYRREVEQSIRAAFAALPADQRRLLRLYFVARLGVAQLGALLEIHHTTICRRLQKSIEAVGQRVNDDLKDRLGLASQELPELLSLVRSQLGISINDILAESQRMSGG